MADPANLPGLVSGMRALEKKCVKSDGKPYIKSFKGGKQVSTEPFHQDMQVTFILQFDVSQIPYSTKELIRWVRAENEEDLAYYVEKDKAHEEFKAVSCR